MNYCIIYGSTRNHLTAKVKSKIKQGWKPIGGVSIEPPTCIGKNELGWDDWLRGEYIQAMTKYETTTNGQPSTDRPDQ